MSRLDVLEAELNNSNTVVQGVKTTIDALIEDLAAAKDDPAQIDRILARGRAMRDVLAEAVARGTAADAEVRGGTAA